ncbi:hypothetical protein EDEG_01800 [Edhazardia aedis USNM 41457]|uniref:Uncharacterized protein n=1 Tax=Edhazardia aedis (strain USNM 41457) TaxID=1003232 RepID=J9D7Y5_EDHAE|nr:hypothetical protein EDEG_01800 [Edhazardia aedis USNM 41457]|eukprot:EJW03906.1 hypothetical protein EDEG_01800 [Edhazardia aedis USNM 41457]
MIQKLPQPIIFEKNQIYIVGPSTKIEFDKCVIFNDFKKPITSMLNKHNKDKIIVFKYTTGIHTLNLFKKLYFTKNYFAICFIVKNYEKFYKDFVLFKDLTNVHYITNKIEQKTEFKEKQAKYYNYIINVFKSMNFNLSKDKVNKATRLAFVPDINASIFTSLNNPETYLTNKNIAASVIFKSAKNTIKNHKLVECENENDSSNTKSLLFTGILTYKKGDICVNKQFYQ